MNPEIPRALEAILLVADSPVETELLAGIVELSEPEVEALLVELATGYATDPRGFQLVRVAGGWRYQTHADLAPYVERFVLDGQAAKLSAAALETLAIVAYKQPISRAQIAAIRGVSVDGVVRTLEQRGYIGEVARDPGPGQAVLFGTTPSFLEKMGIDSLAQLPAIAEFVPGADVVEALEHGLRVDAGAEAPVVADDVAPYHRAPSDAVPSDAWSSDRSLDDLDLTEDGSTDETLTDAALVDVAFAEAVDEANHDAGEPRTPPSDRDPDDERPSLEQLLDGDDGDRPG